MIIRLEEDKRELRVNRKEYEGEIMRTIYQNVKKLDKSAKNLGVREKKLDESGKKMDKIQEKF